MSIKKPYHRNYRAIIEGPNSGYSSWGYILDSNYADSPEHYIRAFLLIQKDLQKLFEFIEPSEESLKTFSYRIHELFMRTCIEIEANFKAILKANIYSPDRDRRGNEIYNIGVYKKINATHHLSSYKVMIPVWNGTRRIFNPFINWSGNNGKLNWYGAYNASKHDRKDNFKQANIENLLDAASALLIVLSSQFKTQDFSPGSTGISISGYEYYEMDRAIGEYFRIEFPDDWQDADKYEFNWSELKDQPDRFQKIDYNLIG